MSGSKIVALSTGHSPAKRCGGMSIAQIYEVWVQLTTERDALNEKVIDFEDRIPRASVTWEGRELKSNDEIDLAVSGYPAAAITIARGHLKAALTAATSDRESMKASPDLAAWNKRIEKLAREIDRCETRIEAMKAETIADVAAKLHVFLKVVAILAGGDKVETAIGLVADMRQLAPSIAFETLKYEFTPDAWGELKRRCA